MKIRAGNDPSNVESIICVNCGITGHKFNIIVDKQLTIDEQDALTSLLIWSGVRSGVINDQRWSDYINNVNSPVWDEKDELVFTGTGTWSLDWWEQVFDEYE